MLRRTYMGVSPLNREEPGKDTSFADNRHLPISQMKNMAKKRCHWRQKSIKKFTPGIIIREPVVGTGISPLSRDSQANTMPVGLVNRPIIRSEAKKPETIGPQKKRKFSSIGSEDLPEPVRRNMSYDEDFKDSVQSHAKTVLIAPGSKRKAGTSQRELMERSSPPKYARMSDSYLDLETDD